MIGHLQTQTAKLAQLCLEKAPQIATAMAGFSELFEGTINLQEDFETTSSPQSS